MWQVRLPHKLLTSHHGQLVVSMKRALKVELNITMSNPSCINESLQKRHKTSDNPALDKSCPEPIVTCGWAGMQCQASRPCHFCSAGSSSRGLIARAYQGPGANKCPG